MFQPFTEQEGVLHAARVFNSQSVALIDCDFEAHTAADGLFQSNSNVYAYGSLFCGGIGRPDFTSGQIFGGGDGARLFSGQLFSADSIFEGGDGTDTIPFSCTVASDGGSGVQLDGGIFRDRSNSVIGGLGSSGAACANPDGFDGGGIVMAGGSVDSLNEISRSVTANSPVFEGNTSTQVYFGVPSEVVFTTIGFSLDPGVFFPEFA